MKVVINKCFGGFGLSDKAVEACIALGMTVGNEFDEGKDFIHLPEDGQYYAEHTHTNAFRCDLRVVQVVEQLGDEANGFCAKLKIVEIPFDGPKGWHIEDYDGKEHVAADHGTWG
jgi:hypothetical protein